MLQIQDTLVSFDVVEKEFICDLKLAGVLVALKVMPELRSMKKNDES